MPANASLTRGQMGMRKTMVDLYAGRSITATQELILEPYEFMVLSRVA